MKKKAKKKKDSKNRIYECYGYIQLSSFARKVYVLLDRSCQKSERIQQKKNVFKKRTKFSLNVFI